MYDRGRGYRNCLSGICEENKNSQFQIGEHRTTETGKGGKL